MLTEAPILLREFAVKDQLVNQITWATNNHIATIRDIDEVSLPSELYWTSAMLRKFCNGKSNRGYVVSTPDDCITGYLFASWGKRDIEIVRLAVHPDFQRKGYGTALVSMLMRSLHPGKRTSMKSLVPERCVEAQLLLRSLGFRAMGMRHRVFPDGVLSRPNRVVLQDGILFQYTLDSE
jgi:ribosomal protein S18 acetylase RimI-like enzyme